MLAQALRRLGHEALFFVHSSDALHRPECRDRDISRPYPDWIRDDSTCITSYSHLLLPHDRLRQTIDAMRGCDALIVNNLGPMFAGRVGKPYITLLTGSDLEVYASTSALRAQYDTHGPGSRLRRKILSTTPMLNLLSRQMRKGIGGAIAFNYFPRGLVPAGDAILDAILERKSSAKPERLAFLMTDTDGLRYSEPPSNSILEIFCGARLTWVKPMKSGTVELDYKGSDVLLRGFAAFCAKYALPVRLHLVRKGQDIEQTEELVNQLGISEKVQWHDEMSQTELYDWYKRSDIVAEQLGNSVVGMAGLDAMALGRPLLANGRPEIFAPLIGEASPICQAKSPEEVCAQLLRLTDVELRQELGRKSREYVVQHFSVRHAAQVCLNVFARAGCAA